LGETRFPVDDRSVAALVRQLLPLSDEDLVDLLARQDLAATQVASAVVRTPLDVAFIDLGTISLPGRAELLDRGRSLFRKYNELAYELVCGECGPITSVRLWPPGTAASVRTVTRRPGVRPTEDNAGNHHEPARNLDGLHPLAEKGDREEDAQERLEVPEDRRPGRSHPVDSGEIEQVRDDAGEDNRVPE